MRGLIVAMLVAGAVALAWTAQPAGCAFCVNEGFRCSKFAPAICGTGCACLVSDASGNGVCVSLH